jgi:biopolymer transport protein ExbD
MSDEPTLDNEPRFRGAPPPASHRRSQKSHDSRTKTDSFVVDASELDTTYHRVEEMSEDVDLLGSRKFKRDDNEIDMTPMVDTTFLLLLFFMITAAFSLQRSLQVPTPRPEDQPSENVVYREQSDDPDTVTVHVDENNTYRVVSTEFDVEAPSTHEMLIRLREACENNRAGRRPTKLLVMANNEALHERVVAAMDAGSSVGMEEIQLMMVEENE